MATKIVTLKNPNGDTIYPVTKADAVDGINVNYSTSEVDTGAKWIDGKTIYKKTVHIPNTGTGSTVTIAHGISNYNHAIKFEGAIVATSGQDWPIPQKQADTGATIAVRADATNIYVNASANLTNGASGYVTLYYTKSS